MPMIPVPRMSDDAYLQEQSRLKNKQSWLNKSFVPPVVATYLNAPQSPTVNSPDATGVSGATSATMGPKGRPAPTLSPFSADSVEVGRMKYQNTPPESSKAAPAPANLVASVAGAAATGVTPPAPQAATPDPMDARKRQILENEELARRNSQRLVLARQTGLATPEMQAGVIDSNAQLRYESDLARRSMTPVREPLTPQQNATNARRGDMELYEQANRMLQTLPPDHPDRAGYERAANFYQQRLTGQTADSTLDAMFGVPGAGMAGLAQSAAGYADRGVAGTRSQTAAAESRARANEVLAGRYEAERGTRLAGEAFEAEQVNKGRDTWRAASDQYLAERQRDKARAESDSRLAAFESDPSAIDQKRRLLETQYLTERAKAERELRLAQGGSGTTPEEANNYAANAMAARHRFGITDKAQSDTVGALRNIQAAISTTNNGTVVGGFWGGVDSATKDVEAVLSFARRLSRMADAGNREEAANIADEVFRALPLPNAEGGYSAGMTVGDAVEGGSMIAGGAAIGAGIGAPLGGVGAVPGALLGGTAGLFGNVIRMATRAFNDSDQKELAAKLTEARTLLDSLRQ